MTRAKSVIFAGDQAWKLGRGSDLVELPDLPSATPDAVAAAVAAMPGVTDGPVVLFLPTSWCLSATVSLEGVPARSRHTALLYQLELLLPLSAEDVAADFIINDARQSALGLCVPLKDVKPVVDALEASGVVIDNITPASVFAAQTVLNGLKGESCDAVFWANENSIEVFSIHDQRVTGWYVVPAEAGDLGAHVTRLAGTRSSPLKIVARSLPRTLLEWLMADPSFRVLSEGPMTVETAAISGVAAGVQPAVNLRRDGLAATDPYRAIRRPLTQAVLAAVLLVVCVCAAAIWRADQYQRLAEGFRDRQAESFHRVFPGRPVPVNVVSRFRSEERSLAPSTAGESLDTPTSVQPTLHALLRAIGGLPETSGLEVQDLRIDEGTFSVEAIAGSRADLDALVQSLRDVPSMQVEPPQAEQVPGKGIRITLTGSRLIKRPGQ